MKPAKLSTFGARRALTAGLLLALLSGCATFSEDGGMDRVQSLTRERTGQDAKRIRTEEDAKTVRQEIDRMLQHPLSVDDAVRIALMNNRELQASYAELGIAEADLVRAGRLRNPVFSFARLKRGDEIEYERSYMMPLIGLLTMPLATRIEDERFQQTQLRAASDAVRLADETRRAYYTAVAAQESALYMERAQKAAGAGAELARRMASVGNWSALQQAQEQTFYADATTQLALARLAATSAREQLTRLMGLWDGSTRFVLPERLPELPAAPRSIANAEADAMANRLDMLMVERELKRRSASVDLSRATRFVNLLDVGYVHNTSNEEPHQTGYEIEIEIPIFDWGTSRVVRAESQYMQAVHRASQIAVNARSEVRLSYQSYRTAYDLAKHYRDEVLPLRKRISEENVLRYNGMLIGVFELLADARSQFVAVSNAIDAKRNFWIADSALQMAMTGGSASVVSLAAAANAAPAESGGH